MKRINFIQKVNQRRYLQKTVVYVVGIFILALGGALSINADLGVSPINSLPFVFSLVMGFDLGIVFAVFLSSLVGIQIIILRKEFKWYQLLQIVGGFMFGYFLDFARFLIGEFYIPTYFGQLILLLMSIICIALGVTMFVSTGFVPMPVEGLIGVIIKKLPKLQFHQVMIYISVFLVLMAVILSFLALGGLYGVREGTVITAILAGKLMPLVRKTINPMLNKVYGNL